MFTPPSSPTPCRTAPLRASPRANDDTARYLFRDASPTRGPSTSSSLSLAPSSSTSDALSAKHSSLAPPIDLKKRIGRRMTWTVIVIPLVLLVITLSTRYLTHPAAFDVLSHGSAALTWTSVKNWQPHKRHPNPEPQGITFPTPTTSSGSTSSTSSTPSTTTSAGSQPIPTVPSTPPALPTPFPQPLDTSLSQNFSTQGCKNFFLNMTQTEPFRECRPFSLLQRSSSAFLQAQTNLSALNAIVWGTCNTDASTATCDGNMAWFRDTLQTQCSTELGVNNAMVVNTLQGLQAYSLMRDTACLVDQQTNSYCYVEAVRNTNPSDLYFYQLPLGIGLPPNTTPSCSACTKSVMQLYAQSNNLTALTSTYNTAATIADSACGEGYVQQASITGAAVGLKATAAWVVVMVPVISVLAGVW